MPYNGYTEARKQANLTWEKKQDRLLLRLPMGTKDKIKAYAKKNNISSVNSFIGELIDKAIE